MAEKETKDQPTYVVIDVKNLDSTQRVHLDDLLREIGNVHRTTSDQPPHHPGSERLSFGSGIQIVGPEDPFADVGGEVTGKVYLRRHRLSPLERLEMKQRPIGSEERIVLEGETLDYVRIGDIGSFRPDLVASEEGEVDGADEQLDKIRTALDESARLGRQTKRRLEALTQRPTRT